MNKQMRALLEESGVLGGRVKCPVCSRDRWDVFHAPDKCPMTSERLQDWVTSLTEVEIDHELEKMGIDVEVAQKKMSASLAGLKQ